jgi:RNA polymerase sigma-70 factor (ECF subfamily)
MELSDQEAVAATLKDRQAFSVLAERYQAPLLRYIRRLGTLDMDVAKDILQETFIKVYINLNDYDQALPFSSWIYRIAHNETLMHFRRQKNRPRPVKNEEELSLFDLIPAELDIVKESDAKLQSARIADAISTLKREYKDILILRFFEDKSYEEISDILEIPMGTAATRLSRGKKALEVLLREEHITDVYYGHDG